MIEFIVLVVLYFTVYQTIMRKIHLLEKKVTQLEKSVWQTSSQTPAQTVEILKPQSMPYVAKEQFVAHTEILPKAQVEIHKESFGSILAKVGVAILVLGVGFFFNYINSRGLVSESVKFILGLILGGVMIGVAEYVKSKTMQYAQVIRGGGIVVWFLTMFVGSIVYKIVSLPVALTILIGIIVVSYLISVREKEETTFLIGIIGAYVVPCIMGFYAHDLTSLVQVLLYICVINIGIVIAARTEDWIRSTVTGFAGSWLVLFSLYGNISILGWQTAWAALTICAATFLVVFVLRDIQKSQKGTTTEYSVFLTVLNSILYVATVYDVLEGTPLALYRGFLIALLGAVHLGVYLYIRSHTENAHHPSALAHFVLFTGLIAAAVPVQFDGVLVTTIWFIEGVLLAYLATIREFKEHAYMYILALTGIGAGIIHMLAYGQYTDASVTGVAMVNQHYIVWLLVALVLHGVAYLWKKTGSTVHFMSVTIASLFLLGQICFIGVSVVEIEKIAEFKKAELYTELRTEEEYYGNTETYTDSQYIHVQEQISEVEKRSSFAYIIFFIGMTTIYLLYGLLKNNKLVRRLGIVTLMITVAQLFFLAWNLGPVFRFISFIGLGVILLVVSYLYVSHNKKSLQSGAMSLLFGLMIASSLCSVNFIPQSAHAAVVDPSAWESATTFAPSTFVASSTVGSWYVAEIDPSVWMHSVQKDFDDIRIVDSAHTEIPYVLLRQGVKAKAITDATEAYPVARVIENTIQKNKIGVAEPDRVIILDTGKEGRVYTGIHLNRTADAKNFRKKVRVYISDSLLGAQSPSWREVEQKNVVYNYTDSSGFVVQDLDMSFSNMASRYIKLQFEEDPLSKTDGAQFANQINIESAQILYESKENAPGTTIRDYLRGNFIFPQDSVMQTIRIESILSQEEKKTTEIVLRDLHGVTHLTLDVDRSVKNFMRDVVVQSSTDGTTWSTAATGQIYRIDSLVFKGENLTLETPVLTAAHVRIVVQNKNDTPLSYASSLRVGVHQLGILFMVKNTDISSLTFLTGNSQAVRPVYEIEKTALYFSDTIPTQVALNTAHANPTYEDKNPLSFAARFPYVINLALVAFVGILGYLGYIWSRKEHTTE